MDTWKLERKVTGFIRENKMADRGGGVLAAVSGGADSLCLLFLLHELKDELGIRLAAFHLNHGLRGAAADRDEEQVQKICGELGVPLHVVHADVAAYAKKERLSEEEAGRVLRYRYLNEAAELFSCEKIATAHQKEDNAETVLMNLFRGSGLRGLGGIPAVRGKIIRPLLCVSRREIEEYLRAKGIVWCEDATNHEDAYTRNKIRNRFLPWVEEEINAQAAEHILNTAFLAREADEYFRKQAEMLLEENAIPTCLFDSQPPVMKRYLVRELLRHNAVDQKDISERHIRAVMELTGPGGGTETALPHGLKAVRGYERIEIRRAPRSGAAPYSIPVPLPGMHGCKTRVFPWKNGLEIPKNQYTKWFDYDKIKNIPVFRSRREGDYFCLPGEKKKLLQRYLIDEKIPKEERDAVLLLADGSHIIWIVGRRISETYKISQATKTVIEISVAQD